jgi:hypothetical protein
MTQCDGRLPRFGGHEQGEAMDGDEMQEWADQVLDASARESEHLSDEELYDRAVIRAAESWMLTDGWVIGDPDDPAVRAYLIEGEGYDPGFADDVLAKMRELAVDER